MSRHEPEITENEGENGEESPFERLKSIRTTYGELLFLLCVDVDGTHLSDVAWDLATVINVVEQEVLLKTDYPKHLWRAKLLSRREVLDQAPYPFYKHNDP